MKAASRALSVCALAALCLSEARAACAAPPRVALVRSSPSSPALSLALTRIEGELVADGFDVIFVKAAAPLSSAPVTEEQGAAASIAIGVDTEARAAELTVVDRITHKSLVRQIAIDELDPTKAANLLAVRAVELLRASLLELLVESSLPSPPRAPKVDAGASHQATLWARRAVVPEEPPDWAVEAGASLHVNPVGGIGPALIGLLRVRRALGNAFAFRASIAGLGTEPRVTAREGTATVGQGLGLLELVAMPWSHFAVRPVFSLGAGALLTTVDGQGVTPYVGRSGTQISFAADAGLGAAIQLGRRFGIALEVHAVLAHPYPSVRFLGAEVARSDAPSFFGNVTVASFL